jgi:hypothetical protein
MEIIQDLEISTSDFWYDLFDGGYINPNDICAKYEDLVKVTEAIKIIRDFKDSCEEQIEGLFQ